MKKTQSGFTLVELMIVVSIIGILAAIAIPKFTAMLNESRHQAGKPMSPGWVWKNGHAVCPHCNGNDGRGDTSSVDTFSSGPVTYTRDRKTNLCFATVDDKSPTMVPCASIQQLFNH